VMRKDFFNLFLKSALPEFDWLLSEMEKSDGWFKLHPPLVETISKFKLQWWKAYDDQRLFNLYHALMFVDLDDLLPLGIPV